MAPRRIVHQPMLIMLTTKMTLMMTMVKAMFFSTFMFQSHARTRRSGLALVPVAILGVAVTGAAHAAQSMCHVGTAAVHVLQPASLSLAMQQQRNDRHSGLRTRGGPDLIPLPGHGSQGSTAEPSMLTDSEDDRDGPIRTLVVREDPITKQFLVQISGEVMIRGSQIDEIERAVRERLSNVSIRLTSVDGQTLRLVPRTRLGAVLEPVTGALQSQLRLSDGEGLLVTYVQPDLPAEVAGLRKFDVLLAMAGKRPLTQKQLTETLAVHAPGDVVSVLALRGGREIEVHVRLVANALIEPTRAGGTPQVMMSGRPREFQFSSTNRSENGSSGGGTPSRPESAPVPPLGGLFGSTPQTGFGPIAVERRDASGNVIEVMQWASPLTASILTGQPFRFPEMTASGQATQVQIDEINARLDRIELMLELLLQNAVGEQSILMQPERTDKGSSSVAPTSELRLQPATADRDRSAP